MLIDPLASAYVGCLYPFNSNISAVSFEVVLGGTTILPQQPACTPCDPDIEECDYPNYRIVSATVTGPASGTGSLAFVVSQDSISSQSLPLMLDLVYLEGQGYTGAPYNPSVTV